MEVDLQKIEWKGICRKLDHALKKQMKRTSDYINIENGSNSYLLLERRDSSLPASHLLEKGLIALCML